MRWLLLFVCLLLLSINPLFAQTDEPEGWPIIERCVGAPTTPPDDWSFDGMIVYHDDNGIHALRDTLDTPYYLAFRNTRQFIDSAILSPNGSLIAVPASYFDYDTTRYGDRYWHIHEILIYSTGLDRQLLFRIPLHHVYRNSSKAGAGAGIEWINENSFAASSSSNYYLNDEVRNLYILDEEVRIEDIAEYSNIRNMLVESATIFLHITVSDENNNRALYQEVAVTDANLGFLTTLSQESLERQEVQFELYDTESDKISIIFLAGQFERESLRALSADGQFFSFSARRITGETTEDFRLYIADLQEQVIIDTCINQQGAKWSPDSRYLVYTDGSLTDDEQGIFVVDWQEGLSYLIYRTTGQVMGWYAG